MLFREKSKADRQKWREFKKEYTGIQKSSISKSTANLRNKPCSPIDYNQLITDILCNENYLEASEIRRPEVVVKRKKPAWAMTEEENQQHEDEDIDELVGFMENFNPKSFIEDVEVKNLIEDIKHRVEQLKAPPAHSKLPKNSSSKFTIHTHQRPKSRQEQVQTKNINGVNPFAKQSAVPQKRPSTAAAIKNQYQTDSQTLKNKIIKNIADSIIKQDKNIAEVHSNASIRRLIERLVIHYFDENSQVLDKYVSPSWKQPDSNKLKVISYKRDRIEHKKSVQNLPYLYPSPLV